MRAQELLKNWLIMVRKTPKFDYRIEIDLSQGSTLFMRLFQKIGEDRILLKSKLINHGEVLGDSLEGMQSNPHYSLFGRHCEDGVEERKREYLERLGKGEINGFINEYREFYETKKKI